MKNLPNKLYLQTTELLDTEELSDFDIEDEDIIVVESF